MKGISFKSAALLYLAALSGTAFAQDATFELPSASSAYVKDHESFKLAANDQETLVKKQNSAAPEVKQSEFKPSWLTGGKVHQYLGLGTLVAAGLTAMSAPEEGCEQNCSATTAKPRETNGTHAKRAEATVATAAATIVTGVAAHWDDIHVADGFIDPDNLHVMLGVTGAALMAYAVNKSMHSTTPV